MKDEKNNFTNIERKVQKFFQKQADSLKVNKDLWPKLESRLDEKLKDTEPHNTKGRLWQWLAGPRLIAISASVGVVLIMIVAGLLWLTTNNSANIMNNVSIQWTSKYGVSFSCDVEASGLNSYVTNFEFQNNSGKDTETIAPDWSDKTNTIDISFSQ